VEGENSGGRACRSNDTPSLEACSGSSCGKLGIFEVWVWLLRFKDVPFGKVSKKHVTTYLQNNVTVWTQMIITK
jgi:hypothetical protein